MTDTTTIQITTDQKAQLDKIGAEGQPYKSKLTMLIEAYNQDSQEAIESHNQAEPSGDLDESRLAEYLADYLVNGENLPEKVAEELR